MRRPTDLAVDTERVRVSQHTDAYNLSRSPASTAKRLSANLSRSSVHTISEKHDDDDNDPNDSKNEEEETTQPTRHTHLQPSIRLLFSQVSRRDLVFLLIPAIATSVIAGGIAPFMTYVIGQAFDAFARFPSSSPSEADRVSLRAEVGVAALQLVALAAGALALSSITSALWISAGERNVMRLRTKVYEAVTSRDMEWFDTKMGGEDAVVTAEGDGPVGAGGLMAKFARETDDVRMGSSLASGMLLQYLTTCITCLALAFTRSYALTLVILSAVPALVIVQTVSQSFAGPLAGAERHQTAIAATLVERALSAITTVKAFNAARDEHASLSSVLDKTAAAAARVNGVWGLTSALSQFSSMAMFVQGFWFGAKLVREGSVSPGDVMAVFWACLIATSNLQMCIPQFITLAKGKFAMVALMTLVEPPAPVPSEPELVPDAAAALSTARTSISTLASSYPKTPYPLPLPPPSPRPIHPIRCSGELALNNVSFAYPSRPTLPILIDVSLFLPASETTFIVGGSGSGKSTVAQLLSKLYAPQSGSVTLDGADIQYIEEEWIRRHIAVVAQGCVLFEGTVHDNVAMGVAGCGGENGRLPEEVTREEVVDACTAALMHEFVRELPDGYETMLGTAGMSLSGGQRQRLALARALLRDPTVLILDEATSALDATTRLLVFEAIKVRRRSKTTIVITHDLSQITASDFVYVLRGGCVVEQGYREDLELSKGAFSEMVAVQGGTGGFVPREDSELGVSSGSDEEEVEWLLEQAEEERREQAEERRHRSVGNVLVNRWMLDAVTDLTRSRAPTPTPFVQQPEQPVASTSGCSDLEMRASTLTRFSSVGATSLARSSTVAGGSLGRNATFPKRITRASFQLPKVTTPPRVYNDIPRLHRRLSLQFTPASPTGGFDKKLPKLKRGSKRVKRETSVSQMSRMESLRYNRNSLVVEDDEEFELEKAAMERSAAEVTRRRQQSAAGGKALRAKWDEASLARLSGIAVDGDEAKENEVSAGVINSERSFIQLVREVYPTLPNKPLLFFGMAVCIVSGAMTPLFSFLLSRLLFEVSIGARNTSTINTYGSLVLGIAATDGFLLGLKFFIMESAGMNWVTKLRKQCYSVVLAQDKKWFDRSENSPVRLVQVLIKDGDDARNLIAVVLGQCLVVSAMLGVGLVWALARGWQLTLAGFAIGPIFAITMAVQANLVAKCERRNKAAREEVAKGYYEAISNIRAIRCMALGSVFRRQFDEAVEHAHRSGVRGAFVEGCTYGVASGLIYLAEALLFFVGAVLVAQGTYSYLQMVEVLNLVVFSVTIGSQLMAFTQRIAKSTQATRDFNKIMSQGVNTDESVGNLCPSIDGDVRFSNVAFTYPERPEAPVLQNVTFRLKSGECVAVVGASGSGKSTVASLLQRLYEPTAGSITIGTTELNKIDVTHLREHVSVVSQNPHLFDATISENISYGNKGMSSIDIRCAAKAARVHEFIESLPKGYDTMVGENASLISGGQAQRLQIARALARPSNILILDECTSALDPANQAAVMETIRSAKIGRTTLMVTHKLPVMQMCDRILVVHEGVVAEEGTYVELMKRNGIFAQLASGGEWSGE